MDIFSAIASRGRSAVQKGGSLVRRVGKSVGGFMPKVAGTKVAAQSQANNSRLSKALRYATERASLAELQIKLAEQTAEEALKLAAHEAAKTGVVLIYNSLGVMNMKHTSIDGAKEEFVAIAQSMMGEDVPLKNFNGGLVVHVSDEEWVWAVWCNHQLFLTADAMSRTGYMHFCRFPVMYIK
jgi:hypothetical protein